MDAILLNAAALHGPASLPLVSASFPAPTVLAFHALEEARQHGPALDALNLAARRPSPFETLEYLETFLGHDEHAVTGQQPLVLLLLGPGGVIGWVALRVLRERVLGLASSRVTFLATHDVERPRLVCRPGDEGRCAEAFLRYLLFAEESPS